MPPGEEMGLLTTQTSSLGSPLDSIAVLNNLGQMFWLGQTKTPGLELVNVGLLISLAFHAEELCNLVLPSGNIRD